MKNLPTLRILVLACAATVALAIPVYGQSASAGSATSATVQQAFRGTEEPYWTQHGRLTFGFQFGFGLENNIPHDISHINFMFVAPQIGFIAWDSPHSRLPLKRFELISQQMLGQSTHPGGSLIGTSLVMHFGFKPFGRMVPYFDAGSGPVHTTIDRNASEITGDTQFLSQGGVGLQYFVSPQRAMVLEYHYFHMSNAGIAEPNHGFNGSIVTVGFQWLRRPRPSSVGTLHHNGFHLPHLW
jgi:opacity protein-like surface antigen